MILIVGLGNPGEKYKNTRHNIGFMVLKEFAEKNNFPDFKFSKKFNALISEDIFDNEKLLLSKPQNFMNESGKVVKKLVSGFPASDGIPLRRDKPRVSRIWVVHDDIDLLLGKIKIVKNRGPAGHKGVQSIVENLGTRDFVRFRVGISSTALPPLIEKQKQTYRPVCRSKDFVLGKFNKDEKKILEEAVEKTIKAIETALKEGIEKAMNEFNS